MIHVQDRRPLMFFEAKRSTSRARSMCKHCNKPTHEGKPECVEHLGRRPYIAALLQKMKQHEKDASRIEKQGTRAVHLDGLHVSEILNDLHMHGPKTIAGLCRATQFSEAIILACVRKMRKEELIKMLTNRRGDTVITLTGNAYSVFAKW